MNKIYTYIQMKAHCVIQIENETHILLSNF